jgi:hypothetical protein
MYLRERIESTFGLIAEGGHIRENSENYLELRRFNKTLQIEWYPLSNTFCTTYSSAFGFYTSDLPPGLREGWKRFYKRSRYTWKDFRSI